jgi:hypothetical protein
MNDTKFSKKELDILFELNTEKDNLSLFQTGFGIHAINVEVIKIKLSLFICISIDINQKTKLIHKYEFKENGVDYILIENKSYDTNFNSLFDVKAFIKKCDGDYFLDNTIRNNEFNKNFDTYYLENNNISLSVLD